jgi:hypothetical protein
MQVCFDLLAWHPLLVCTSTCTMNTHIYMRCVALGVAPAPHLQVGYCLLRL